MKYIKAKNILPDEIIKIIQEYVDGEFIYIPRKLGEEMAWGEKSGSKGLFRERNAQIYIKYNNGYKITELSTEYYLSEQSIRRIISQEKAKAQI